jgi:hypothetical protein
VTLTADQIATLRFYITTHGAIVELDDQNKPVRFIGHLEELEYRNLIQCSALMFNTLTEIRKVSVAAIEILEAAHIDALTAGLQEAVASLDLAQRAALDGPFSLFAEPLHGRK